MCSQIEEDAACLRYPNLCLSVGGGNRGIKIEISVELKYTTQCSVSNKLLGSDKIEIPPAVLMDTNQ